MTIASSPLFWPGLLFARLNALRKQGRAIVLAGLGHETRVVASTVVS